MKNNTSLHYLLFSTVLYLCKQLLVNTAYFKGKKKLKGQYIFFLQNEQINKQKRKAKNTSSIFSH